MGQRDVSLAQHQFPLVRSQPGLAQRQRSLGLWAGSPLAAAYRCGKCAVWDPDWSPDGKKLVFYEEGVGIRVVTVGRSDARTLAKT